MDALGDTHLALQSFLNSEPPSDLGLKYLWIYGAFQALYVQQDAFLAIGEALGKGSDPKNLPIDVSQIREDRNNIVGHPFHRQGGPLEIRGASHFLVQSELEAHAVKVLRLDSNSEGARYSFIDLGKLIRVQEESLAKKLSVWLSEGSTH